MKKSYLMISAAAIIFAGCSSNDSFKEIDTQDTPIAFRSYTQPNTKATENNDKSYAWDLEDHHSTFVVSGFRTVTGEDDTWVFQDQTISWQDTDNDNVNDAWDYTPHRFWERRATSYTFYAAAPDITEGSGNSLTHKWVLNKNASTESGYNSEYTNDTWYYTYTGFSLTDHDATEGDATDSGDNYIASFATAAPEKDLMIAEKCNWTTIGTTVNLHFIHVLSRLNVLVQRGTKLNPDDVVKIQSFEVCKFKDGGNFVENLYNAVATTPGINTRWTSLSNNTIDYTSSTDIIDPSNTRELEVKYDPTADDNETGRDDIKQYILQSLVVPQNITFENIDINGKLESDHSTAAAQTYLHIKYTIHNDGWTGNKTEVFEGYYNLAKAFGATSGTVSFTEGWQNNLTLIINPDVIDFDPDVSEWGDRNFEYDIE
jgi:hypothetical protein